MEPIVLGDCVFPWPISTMTLMVDGATHHHANKTIFLFQSPYLEHHWHIISYHSALESSIVSLLTWLAQVWPLLLLSSSPNTVVAWLCCTSIKLPFGGISQLMVGMSSAIVENWSTFSSPSDVFRRNALDFSNCVAWFLEFVDGWWSVDLRCLRRNRRSIRVWRNWRPVAKYRNTLQA